MVRTKVFVGNLSFKIRENQLTELFSAAGKVSGANIITRGDRSLGYGFVEMESEEEAHRSVQLLNDKEIEGRQIRVEVAKPKAEGEAAAGSPAGERAPRQRRPRAPRAPAAGAAPGASGSPAPAADGDRQRKPRQRRPRGPRPAGDGSAPAAEGSAGPSAERKPRQPREPRAPRAPRPDQGPRNPSSTTLFVANLPFTYDDKGLADLFAGLSVKESHVVMKRNGKSKGFGFVEFNNETDQKNALGQVDGRDVEGRKLIVKVALTESIAQLTADAAEQK